MAENGLTPRAHPTAEPGLGLSLAYLRSDTCTHLGLGLGLGSPVPHSAPDCSWGRNIETPGEDPYLTGEYAEWSAFLQLFVPGLAHAACRAATIAERRQPLNADKQFSISVDAKGRCSGRISNKQTNKQTSKQTSKQTNRILRIQVRQGVSGGAGRPVPSAGSHLGSLLLGAAPTWAHPIPARAASPSTRATY